MKKLLTLFAAGIAFVPAYAQYRTTATVVRNQDAAKTEKQVGMSAKKVSHSTAPTSTTSNRGTANYSAWFNYDESKFFDGLSSASVWPMYQDSSLLVRAATTPFYWYVHDLGMSFDPTSKAYTSEALNPDATHNFEVKASNAYTIDSVEVLGFYSRKSYNNYTDTLIIDVVRTGNTGTYSLQYNKDPYFAPMTADSAPDFQTAIYDNINNKMSDSVTGVYRIVKVLNAAAFADSTTDGLHNWKFSVGTISVPAGEGVVAVAHFKSGHTYAFGHDLDSTNYWSHYCLEPNGEDTYPTQNVGDATAGLIVTTQTRYLQPSTFSGHRIYPTTFLYGETAGFDFPYFGFHLNCTTCVGVGIPSISTTVKVGSAYPNPATNSVSIPVTMKEAASVNVILSNTVGQVLATQNLGQLTANQTKNAAFSTAGIANGIYFLTVEANGARTTSRFVVAH